MLIEDFKKKPFLGIIRGVKEEVLEPLTETITSSELETVEITLNTSNALSLIKKMVKTANGKIVIGAGTVLSVDDVKKSIDNGASFIVSPVFIPAIVDYCVKHSIPNFPGAITPQEIYQAWTAGASMVKVFPIKFYGPNYIKEIKGPFDNIDLLACGGINPQNIQEFFKKGASAVAFGGSIFNNEWMQLKNLHFIKESINLLIRSYSKIEKP